MKLKQSLEWVEHTINDKYGKVEVNDMNDNKLLDEYVNKVQIETNENGNIITLPLHKELNWYYIDFKIMEEINSFLRMTNHSILEPTSSRDMNDIIQKVIKDDPFFCEDI